MWNTYLEAAFEAAFQDTHLTSNCLCDLVFSLDRSMWLDNGEDLLSLAQAKRFQETQCCRLSAIFRTQLSQRKIQAELR